MPIEVAIWDITGKKVSRMDYSAIESEQKLKEVILQDLSVISDELMLIGSEVVTAQGKKIDILAVNGEGKLSVIELKKAKTPREVVAQALDYASWVESLTYKEITDIFKDKNKDKSFEACFAEKFSIDPPEALNQEHDIIIVSSQLDPQTERIINYLATSYSVPINAVFFRHFTDGNKKYLTRSWLVDPNKAINKSGSISSKSKEEEWNGQDFVGNVDFGSNGISSWEDCIKYGFISAGGGKWYIASLKQAFMGARIFAMIPKKGYVGVGLVKDVAQPVTDFKVMHQGKMTSILDVPLKAEGLKLNADDSENCEHFIAVEWIETVPESEAYWVKGMRANQNSVFKLKSDFTLERLVKYFKLDEDA